MSRRPDSYDVPDTAWFLAFVTMGCLFLLGIVACVLEFLK